MLTNSDHRGPAVCLHVLLLFAGFQLCLLCVHKCRNLVKLGGDLSKLSVQVERPAMVLMPKFVPCLAHTALLLGLGVQQHARHIQLVFVCRMEHVWQDLVAIVRTQLLVPVVQCQDSPIAFCVDDGHLVPSLQRDVGAKLREERWRVLDTIVDFLCRYANSGVVPPEAFSQEHLRDIEMLKGVLAMLGRFSA